VLLELNPIELFDRRIRGMMLPWRHRRCQETS